MASYTKERSKYGGMVGTILVHSTNKLQTANDPTEGPFKSVLPAGYLRCDGSILNAKDYLALSQVLGTGSITRFGKEGAIIREPDANTGDLGQFQLPDLGSKVIVGGRGTGIYNNLIVDKEGVNTVVNRVGAQVEVISNFGNRITSNFVGTCQVTASGEIDFLGNPRYIVDRKTSETQLNIDNYLGHAHSASQKYINYSDRHLVGDGDSGKDQGQKLANAGSGMELDFAEDWEAESIHQHNITAPTSYTNEFKYEHDQFDVDISAIEAAVDVDVADIDKIDELVTPFILVEYIIKF